MSSLSKLIGDKVISSRSEKETKTSCLEGVGKVVGLYFSAHWCPPCRAFTPQLVQWYHNVKKGSNGENFDIVFLSSDRDLAQFKEYFREMPWYAVPYEARDVKNNLSRKFKVTGIPTLVFVNAETGNIITGDGRSVVLEDPDGNDFPWSPKPVLELLNGDLIDKSKRTTFEAVHKNMDYIGIYFSAHWCGPCRAFTPQLVKTYEMVKQSSKKFEIIFCSSDREEESFQEYYASMPWLALPYGDSRKKSLSRFFDVSGIPTLVILDKEGKIVNGSGRAAVSSDPDGLEFPWKPKPANLLTGTTAADLNDNPSIIWFTDGSNQNLTEAQKSMTAVAVDYEETDLNLLFFFAGSEDEDDDTVKSLRTFAALPKKTPLLVIVDIPNQMKYVSDDEVSETSVRNMVEGYLKVACPEGNPTLDGKPSLEGKPLR